MACRINDAAADHNGCRFWYKCQYCRIAHFHLERKKMIEVKRMEQCNTLPRQGRADAAKQYFNCRYCDKAYVYRGQLVSHERAHTGEKPFRCQYCQKAFSHMYSMRVHERIHTGVKPFKCKFCPKEFSHSGNRTLHETRHNRDNSLLKCKTCRELFPDLKSLEDHEKKHEEKARKKGYKCKVCAKTFLKNSQKKVHELIHTRAKCSFLCKWCGKGYLHATFFNKHESTCKRGAKVS